MVLPITHLGNGRQLNSPLRVGQNEVFLKMPTHNFGYLVVVNLVTVT